MMGLTAGALAQPNRWAVASNVLRMDPTTLAAVVANVSAWRLEKKGGDSQAWHHHKKRSAWGNALRTGPRTTKIRAGGTTGN